MRRLYIFLLLNFYLKLIFAQLQAIQSHLLLKKESDVCLQPPSNCKLNCLYGFIKFGSQCICFCQIDPCLVCFLNISEKIFIKIIFRKKFVILAKLALATENLQNVFHLVLY